MKKKNIFFAGVLAFALIFVLAFTACEPVDDTPEPEPEPKEYEDYFGKWSDLWGTRPYTINIGEDTDGEYFEFRFTDNREETNQYYIGNLSFDLVDLEWTKVTNADNDSKVDFPNGWKISGVLDSVTNNTKATLGTGPAHQYFQKMFLDPIKDKEEGEEVIIYVFLNAKDIEIKGETGYTEPRDADKTYSAGQVLKLGTADGIFTATVDNTTEDVAYIGFEKL